MLLSLLSEGVLVIMAVSSETDASFLSENVFPSGWKWQRMPGLLKMMVPACGAGEARPRRSTAGGGLPY